VNQSPEVLSTLAATIVAGKGDYSRRFWRL